MSFFGSIYADPDLPHRARTVYMYLRDRAGGGSCWPGVKTIARDLHLSPRTVQRALNDLERAGYIQRQRRHRENGSCTSNLKPVEVTFKQGQSVFDVLQQVCKDNKLHMEFSMTPIYNSAYIEGIGNLYEFDCGEVSGWMYKVNDWFPNYGCSRYQLQNGDVVEWEYTCELGKDIGGGYATGGDA